MSEPVKLKEKEVDPLPVYLVAMGGDGLKYWARPRISDARFTEEVKRRAGSCRIVDEAFRQPGDGVEITW